MAPILIVDDEHPLLHALSMELERSGHECLLAETGSKALELLSENSPALAILDVQLPDMSGIEILRRLKADLPEVPVLIVTAYASVDSAVEAMKEGAIDYLEKPLDLEELNLVVARELRNARLQSEVEAYRRDARRGAHTQPVIGESQALEQVRQVVARLAEVPVDRASELPTVLLEGETGCGKDLLAQHIHYTGVLAERPFVQVNCSGLPRELVESELFGHEKGAFTSAAQRKQGLFEVANGGTIFLDEIGDMPLDIQAKLLNVIEHRRVRRVGGTRDYPVDVRVIAATNRDLAASVEGGSFRSDLYFRLKVVNIHVPPLRERGEDVIILARFFLERFKQKYRKPELELDAGLERALRSWHWPGNIRELAHTVEHLVLLSDGISLPAPAFAQVGVPSGSRVSPGQSSSAMASSAMASPAMASPAMAPSAMAPRSRLRFDFTEGDCRLETVERQLIESALEHTNGNVSEVARLLGLSRGSLRHRIEKWGIDPSS